MLHEFFLKKQPISPQWIIPLRFICKIPFSLFIKTAFETTDVKLWENFANNIEFREEQISMGYNLADEFLKNLE